MANSVHFSHKNIQEAVCPLHLGSDYILGKLKYSSLNKLHYHFNIFLGPCSFCFCLIVVKALFLGSPHGHIVKNLSNRKKNQSTKSLNEIK